VADRIACDLKIVVSGAPFKIETYTTQTVKEVVEVALAKAGIPHPDTPSNPTWELRAEDGTKLRCLVGDVPGGLVDGETVLFLDPEVGGGGEQGGEVVESGYIYTGWQGTEPAEGTRRSVIRNALRARMGDDTRDLIGVDAASLAFADAVEEALLKIDIGADPTGEVSPASTAMDVLDGLRIDRTREGAILDIGQRVTELADKFVQGRRDAAECYRLTGADPSDGSDAMLAREAVDEVRRFRAEYDEFEKAIAAVGEALDRIDAPQGATYAKRIDRLYRELRGEGTCASNRATRHRRPGKRGPRSS
jgi:hypothetical protein